MTTPTTPTPARAPRAILAFLVPSLLGIVVFMVPITDPDGATTIPVAFLADAVAAGLGDVLPVLTVSLMAISVLGSGLHLALGSRRTLPPFVHSLFSATPVWFAIRTLGLALGIATLFQLGPQWLWGENTGGLVHGLADTLVTVFLFAGFLLPLLLNFGLIEFAGTLANKVMRPLFTVPGRASVDALASWLGDSTIGVLMTNQQHLAGNYTRREAAVMGTTFNVVSLTFTIVILGYLSIEHMFAPFYLTVVIAGFVAAVIMPRIPPLSRISDEPAAGARPRPQPRSEHGTLLGRAWRNALERSSSARIWEIGRHGLSNVLEMWLSIIPVIMAVGTVAVLIAEHTPLFTWLGLPFIPLLELLQVPEAQAASTTMLIGFADMLLPAVLGAQIEAEMTRFIIGALSITQLIFMSEVGGLLLATEIPVKFRHLVAVFLLRTLISLPIIVACAHVVY